MKDFNENFRITPASCKTCDPPDSSIYFPKAEKKMPIRYESPNNYEQVVICRRILCL